MQEPLISFLAAKNFTGKSFNKHPQWYNQPLRLTKEQKQNPILIFAEFFECYHLDEVRQILWAWLVEVMSCHHSISDDSCARSNHIYFYEKMETLVECCFIMQKKEQKRLRKLDRKKNKQQKKANISQMVDAAVNLHDKNNNDHSAGENDEILNKPPQLVERVGKDPLNVISHVFNDESLQFLQEQLRDWQMVALSADTSIYEGGEQRGLVLNFIEQLHLFIDALFIINTRHTKEEIKYKETTTFLNQKQVAEPLQVINAFFNTFPVVYIRRELNDLLEAGLTFTGTYPENMNEVQLLYTYRNILCLVESAYQISKNE